MGGRWWRLLMVWLVVVGVVLKGFVRVEGWVGWGWGGVCSSVFICIWGVCYSWFGDWWLLFWLFSVFGGCGVDEVMLRVIVFVRLWIIFGWYYCVVGEEKWVWLFKVFVLVVWFVIKYMLGVGWCGVGSGV